MSAERRTPLLSRNLLALWFSASALLSGCATKPAIPTSPTVAASATGTAPSAPLIAPAIVAEERPLELHGPELTSEARARFQDERSGKIARRSQVNAHPAQIAELCLRAALEPRFLGFGIMLCPAMPVVWVAAVGTTKGVKYAHASLREPSLKIPEKEVGRIAQTLGANATAVAVAERAMRLATPAGFAGTQESRPRLAVAIKSAAIVQTESRPGLVIVAEAQAVGAGGLALSPTQHTSAYRPLTRWDASDEELRRAIEESLDALAQSIAETYTQVPRRTAPRVETRADHATTDDPVVLLGADGSPISPRSKPASSLPSPGDRWTYRLTEPRRGQALTRTHQITVESVTAEAVIERSAHAPHRNGSYLVREGEVVLFSPYLASFDPHLAGLSAMRVEKDPYSCDMHFCSTSARVIGNETVRVPAGEFETLKVEVQEAWTARWPGAGPGGARTLTVWYSPRAKRAVKFSSRGYGGAHFKTEFDLELEDYKLN